MHKPEFALENETNKILCDFKIQKDHVIPVRKPDLVLINKQITTTCQQVDFSVPVNYIMQIKEREKIDKYLDLAWELENLWSMEVTMISIVIGVLRTDWWN